MEWFLLLFYFFYQTQWDIVVDSLFAILSDAFESGMIPEYLNFALLFLIPKVETIEYLRQFGPINLNTVVYKLITNMVAIKMKVVLPMFISFVPERNIIDNIVIA